MSYSLLSFLFLFFFLALLEFELRALCLLGKGNVPVSFCCLVIFQIESPAFSWGQPYTTILLPLLVE
jgi:hypothetical protein